MKKGIKTSQCDELGCFFSDWEIIRKFGFKLISSEKEFSTILGGYCVSTFSNENVYLKVRYYPKKGSLNEVVGLSVVNLKAEKGEKKFFLLQSYVEANRREDYPSIDAYKEIDNLWTRLNLYLKDLEKYFSDKPIKDAIEGRKWLHVPFDWGPYK